MLFISIKDSETMADEKMNALKKEMGISKKSETVHVVVRVRPMNKKEKQTGCEQAVLVDPSSGSIVLNNPKDGGKEDPKK